MSLLSPFRINELEINNLKHMLILNSLKSHLSAIAFIFCAVDPEKEDEDCLTLEYRQTKAVVVQSHHCQNARLSSSPPFLSKENKVHEVNLRKKMIPVTRFIFEKVLS